MTKIMTLYYSFFILFLCLGRSDFTTTESTAEIIYDQYGAFTDGDLEEYEEKQPM